MRVKAVLAGESSVGKSSLYQRLESDTFTSSHMPTVSGSFAKLIVPMGGEEAEIGLWDTAGQEKFRSIAPLYFQRAAIVVLVFSVASRQSYDSVDEWYELAKTHAPPESRFFLVGNKIDIDGRVVTFDEAQEKSHRLKADVYIETSASTGDGCEGLMAAFSQYLERQDLQTHEMIQGKRDTPVPLEVGTTPRSAPAKACC
jgi:small GTP-binding protein